MLLIVNADDLGASEANNDETFALMESGLVTSATLMANGPAFEDAVKHSRRFPNCSFGVHLNLTSFAPLSRSHNLAPALRAGEFFRELLAQRFSGELRKALEQELMLQVQRVVDAGVPVTHFDSHHFIHSSRELFFVVKAVQRRFGIRKVRCTLEVFSEKSVIHTAKRKVFDYALRNIYTTVSPDCCCEFRRFHSVLVHNRLPNLRCLELLVHPGSVNPSYIEDVNLLKSNWRQLLPPNVAVGSYHLL
jgi:chitin disaccharide deacetylase